MAGNSCSSSSSDSKDSRWYFTAEQLANSPSRRHGIDADQELSYRQLTAYLIQEMGQRLQVSQLCINTAIVYMHRFYAFHSFTHFHRNGIAAASLFLAAKVEEQPRKLEHVIKVAHLCLTQDAQTPHPSPELYAEQAQDLVFNENVLLQTLGFDVAIDHPHTHVVKTCHLVKACKDLAQTSYFLASNSLHLTPMCLQYRPTVVACFCIYLACKWSRWEIPQSTEGKHWFHYVDKTVTMDLLKQLTDEFIAIYEKSPARLKSKLNSIKALAQGARISEPPRPIPESSNSSNVQQAQSETQRRPESFSSHHRSHHSSSSHSVSSHHHHSKQILPNELGEHIGVKVPQLHKTYPVGSHSNRPRPDRADRPDRPDRPDRADRTDRPDRPERPDRSDRTDRTDRTDRPDRLDRADRLERPDRSQIPESQYTLPPHGTGKQIPPSGGIRPVNVSRGHGLPATNVPPSSQRSVHPHDPTYHKNRNTVTPLNTPLSGSKILPKNSDTQRHVVKDSSGRPVDPNKISMKHTSSNMYPPQNVGNANLDMSRNMLPPQGSVSVSSRSYLPPNSMQPPNYNQAVSNRSNNSSSSSSSSSNIKYEQSVQQHASMPTTQKQSSESSFNTTNLKSTDEIKSEQMEICSPSKVTFVQPSQQTSLLQPSIPSKTSSIFSPEWNERTAPSLNQSGLNNSSSGNNLKQMNQNSIKTSRDSPKKIDRDRRSETPKKDKLRNEMLGHDLTKNLQSDKRNVTKKMPDNSGNITSHNLNLTFENKLQQSTLATNKRPFSNNETIIKTEDEFMRESKKPKIDHHSPPKIDQKINLPYPYEQSSSEILKPIKPYSSTINGIETNPDLVSSLLKESLCSESKFTGTGLNKNEPYMELEDTKQINQQQQLQHQQSQHQQQPQQLQQQPLITPKTEPSQPQQQIIAKIEPLQQPQQLIAVKLEPSVVVQPSQQQSDLPVKEEKVSPIGEDYLKPKVEKKKKKDKHKHKDKDKAKIKEEKKKHKKDKDKHKDRDRSSGTEHEQNPVKIKISKDKLNLPPVETPTPQVSGFKIKIPKDRIKGEINTHYPPEESSTSLSVSQPPASSLKIKISKDKIENYSHQQQSSSSYPGNGSNFHGHSSTKKKDRDRDRDRDKEKKRSGEFNKQNGNGGNNSGSGGVSGSSSTKSQSSNSNKIHQYANNMSQLFGESHDEENLSPIQKVMPHQLPRNSHNESNKYLHQQQMTNNYHGSKQ